MPLQSPTLDEIADIAEGYGLSLDDSDLESFQGSGHFMSAKKLTCTPSDSAS